MAKKKKRQENSNPTIEQVIKKRRADLGLKVAYQSLLARIVMLVIIGVLLCSQVFMITQANGMGMFPSVKDGDLVIAFRLQREYLQGDVIVYTQDGTKQIGRIVGKSSDLVNIDDSGTLLINGVPQTGEILYPTYPKKGITYPVQVMVDQVFVLGDYRTQAKDSRDYGSISLDDVEGKVITIIRRRGL